MEVISIDGTEYVRASTIAKRFKYTSDYVGQLCRGSKVEAKLVGRTWYVNPVSLEEHKNNRYEKIASSSQGDKIMINKPQLAVSRQNVEPVLRKETVKGLSHQDRTAGEARFLKRIVWQPTKYEADTSELMPPLRAVREPAEIKVEIAEATKVKIKDTSKAIDLETEPLPEVSLSGGLKVSSLDEIYDDSPENLALTDIFGPEEGKINHVLIKNEEKSVQVKSAPFSDGKRFVDRLVAKVEPSELTKPTKPETKDIDEKYTYPVKIKASKSELSLQVPSFTPARVRATSQKGISSAFIGEASRPLLNQLIILLLVISSLCFLVAILGLERVIEVTASDYFTSYRFNFSLPEIWENLRS